LNSIYKSFLKSLTEAVSLKELQTKIGRKKN